MRRLSIFMLGVSTLGVSNKVALQENVPFWNASLFDMIVSAGAFPTFGPVSKIAAIRFWHVTSCKK